ncbi:MAG: hypothetical protein JNL03_10365 [Prolixibacteraceae bacterium]|nr:hypothetical protein [Prolixibacteraceae bacterium]
MKSARAFKIFYETSYNKEDSPFSAQKRLDEFIAGFIRETPLKLEILGSYITAGQTIKFYTALADFKYLVEFSDSLNRYWYLLRAYSGALSKLEENLSVKGTKSLYSYYFEKYGDRRTLRDEHWFENKRWEFLDELYSIFSKDELDVFVAKYQKILNDSFKVYQSCLIEFIASLEKLQASSDHIENLNSN